MKSKLTPKENFLRLTTGELPEYIPVYSMGFPGYKESPCRIMGPSLFDETHLSPSPTGRTDIWGVKYIANAETNFACIPEPNNFLLTDVTKWRDVIKFPKLPGSVDWEKLAAEDYKNADIDRSQSAAMATIGLMPFQQFIAFMGFSEGLLACAEEPEEVEELLHKMADLYVPIVEATVEYYTPDLLYLLDDTAANHTPFISPSFFKDVLKPVYARLTKPALERGIPIQFHNCGKCGPFVEDMMEIGTKIWDPAQLSNDLLAIKAKHGRNIALAGCYTWVPGENDTEESVRQGVRDCIDTYGKDGGFSFFGSLMARYGDTSLDEANHWIADEAYNYGRDYYLK
ncbi:MAG: hypothetical protein LBN00_00395 [Oscillospiraceae bacterium]|jgi:hypothetical protein|nr:hypothetical protein [Oscillospiraceae bacterium]